MLIEHLQKATIQFTLLQAVYIAFQKQGNNNMCQCFHQNLLLKICQEMFARKKEYQETEKAHTRGINMQLLICSSDSSFHFKVPSPLSDHKE